MTLEPFATQKPRHIGPNRARSPVLVRLIEIADAMRFGYKNVGKAAGQSASTLINIRAGQAPSVATVERCAGVMGYRLALLPLNGAVRATAWALRIREEIVEVTLDEKKAQAWAGRGWTVVRLIEEEVADAQQ